MTALRDLVGLGSPPGAAAFPGYVLSPPRLLEFAEAEEEAAAQYLRRVVKSSADLPPPIRHALQQRAIDNLRENPFAYGSERFDRWALSMSAAAFLAWLLLRIHRPEITLAQASTLMCDGDLSTKTDAVWNLWGYQSDSRSTGRGSSTDSADPLPADEE